MRGLGLMLLGAIALAFAGCAADESPSSFPDAEDDVTLGVPMAVADAGAEFEGDPAAAPEPPDHGISARDEPGDAASEDGVPAEALDPDFASNSGSCFDGIDNNEADGIDCGDPACQTLASCCVGHGDCCSAVAQPPLPASTSFVGCDGMSVDACVADATAFGPVEPWVDDGLLSPGGNELYDGGLRLGDEVDLTQHRVELSTVFHRAASCGVTCLESAGLGFTAQASLGAMSNVHPLVSLLLSGSRDDVSLVIEGEIVTQWAVESDSEPWTLVVRPTGEISVLRDGVDLGVDEVIEPVSAARLVVYGRSRDLDDGFGPGTRLGAISATVSLCDIPDAWQAGSELILSHEGSAVDFDFAAEPSRATNGSETWLAFQSSDGIYFAQPTNDLSYSLTSDEGAPAFTGSASYDQGSVSQPALIRGEGSWVLYYAAQSAGGTRSIGRAESSDPALGFTADALPRLDPASYSSVTGFDAPTVALAPDGTWVMIVRAHLLDGSACLMSFYSVDAGMTWSAIEDDDLAELTRTAVDGAIADEIGSPSIVIHNGAWHVYFASRSGTRWSIGMLASDELLYWRSLGAVFRGDEGDFDRLGASGPHVESADDEVVMLYTGHDGARTHLARIVRQGTTNGTF